MMSVKLNDIAILNIRGVDNCCIINGISKSKALNLQPILDLNKKKVEKLWLLMILKLNNTNFTTTKI